MSFPQESDKKNRYGSVPGMRDNELASPAELERVVVWYEWQPVLALRPQWRQGRIPYDGMGAIDWEAVGTVKCQKLGAGGWNVALATRRICELLGPDRVLRVRTAERELRSLPERAEDYPEYDELVSLGLVPAKR